jgi:hypothetical protein
MRQKAPLLTIGRVCASVLELSVHLGERAWPTPEVDAAVAARLRRQAVRRPELATAGAGVEAVARDQDHPSMQQQAVDQAGQTTGCMHAHNDEHLLTNKLFFVPHQFRSYPSRRHKQGTKLTCHALV